MRLTEFCVYNYRCIEECKVKIRDYLSFIGPNNSGKSTVLHAIEMFLNQTKPDKEEWRYGCEDEPIIFEGLFEDLLDWERDTPGIAGIVYEGKIRLRYIAEEADGKVNVRYEAFTQDMEIEGWSSKWSELPEEIKSVAINLEIDNYTKWRTKANQERVREHLPKDLPEIVTYGEPRWSDESISISAALKLALPTAVIVPAVLDASDDAKTTSRTPFGLLLNRVVIPAIQSSDEYSELIHAISSLSARLSGVDGEQLEPVKKLADDLSRSMSSVMDARVVITLATPDTEKFLGYNAVIRLDDGIETPIAFQGHGIQRSLIFALIELLARQNSIIEEHETGTKQRATVLLFEEPELYMHPHLMRRLSEALQDISERNNWQVVISTHSPFLIDVADDPLSLVIIQKDAPESSPTILQLETNPFEDGLDGHNDRMALRASLDFHPTVNEAFFAQRVILVEGDTELALFKHARQLLTMASIDPDKESQTTIISCGGKWTISGMARLLLSFGISFRIIHDLDRKDLTDQEVESLPAIHPYRANSHIEKAAGGASIYVIEDTLEHIIWDADQHPPQKDKPYRTWLKIKSICEENETLEGYPILQELIRFAYDW